MNTDNQKTVPLDDVLTELALAQDIPDAALLDEYTRRFPHYAEALTSYAIDLAVEAAIERSSSAAPTPATSALAMRAMSRFQNRKFEARTRTPAAVTAPPSVANPIASCSTSELRELVLRMQINNVFMLKLRDRRIEAGTIPGWFCGTLAHELSVPVDVLRAHFSAPARIPDETRFKADRKPEVATKETFEEAIETSGLTPEQKAVLRRK